MEEITEAAKAVYANFSDEEKRELEDLFRAMDKNGDGKISLQEFMASWEGDSLFKRSFFNLIDQNGDGTLQLEELLTLCYVSASGRPFCDACGVFITGLYFTCTHCCLNNKLGESYDLCIPCYHGREFEHQHSEFVDNYTLVLKMQDMLSSAPQEAQTGSPQSLKNDGSKSMKGRVKKVFRSFATMLSVAADVDQLSSTLSSNFS